jgi:hypothetical protein
MVQVVASKRITPGFGHLAVLVDSLRLEVPSSDERGTFREDMNVE